MAAKISQAAKNLKPKRKISPNDFAILPTSL